MKEPENTTATIIQVPSPSAGGEPISVALKAKKDEHPMNPSGWSIIAFAPSASIRCVRGHQPRHLSLFIRSIVALCGHHTTDTVLYNDIEAGVHKITQGEFNATHS
jgi:hypothetical protein